MVWGDDVSDKTAMLAGTAVCTGSSSVSQRCVVRHPLAFGILRCACVRGKRRWICNTPRPVGNSRRVMSRDTKVRSVPVYKVSCIL